MGFFKKEKQSKKDRWEELLNEFDTSENYGQYYSEDLTLDDLELFLRHDWELIGLSNSEDLGYFFRRVKE